MRAHLAAVWECVRFAWAGSLSRANGLATLLGTPLLYFLADQYKSGDLKPPPGWLGLFISALESAAAAWVVIFVCRLVYAPFHLMVVKDARVAGLERQAGQPNQVDRGLTKESSGAQTRNVLIEQGRKLVRRFMSQINYQKRHDAGFRDFLEASDVYYGLRPLLSENFMSLLRMVQPIMYSLNRGAGMPVIAQEFLDELDRLENAGRGSGRR